ncbi:hypothetical protein TNCV_1483561 [Trichonephila clavipes]|nr:hypothetical protein TNCV_1483561 [Trichonephila clavipes]
MTKRDERKLMQIVKSNCELSLQACEMDSKKQEDCVIPSINDYRLESEFDSSRIAPYRGFDLSFHDIGSPIGWNRTTIVQIWNIWAQEGHTESPVGPQKSSATNA